jgi:hypothetical protein
VIFLNQSIILGYTRQEADTLPSIWQETSRDPVWNCSSGLDLYTDAKE